MSWQQQVYERLLSSPREWRRLGDIFEEIKSKIPMHFALRHFNRCSPSAITTFDVDKAQWLLFTHHVRLMGIKREGKDYRWEYPDKIRLSPIDGEKCPACDGAVYKGSWASRSKISDPRCIPFICENCNAPPAIAESPPQPAPQPPPLPVPLPPIPSPFEATKSLATSLGLTPRQAAKVPILITTESSITLTYRRILATELAKVLNLSINRVEKELIRHKNDFNAVLAYHGKELKYPTLFLARLNVRAAWNHVSRAASWAK